MSLSSIAFDFAWYAVPEGGEMSTSGPTHVERLAHVGTFIVGLTAAVGLIFSGVTSCVANRTLDLTRKDQERALEQSLRGQASLVSIWQEEGDTSQPRDVTLHLVNRSLDPISLWTIYLEGPALRSRKSVTIERTFTNLAPCTELVIKVPAMFKELDWRFVNGGSTPGPVFLKFRDSRGNSWARSPDGYLDEIEDYAPGFNPQLASVLKLTGSKMVPAHDCSTPAYDREG
jgi:hypothetical protein